MPCAKGMSKCRAGCGHRQSVNEYRDWRIQWEQDCEDACAGWAAEEADFRAEHPAPTFGDWLRDGGWGDMRGAA